MENQDKFYILTVNRSAHLMQIMVLALEPLNVSCTSSSECQLFYTLGHDTRDVLILISLKGFYCQGQILDPGGVGTCKAVRLMCFTNFLY